MGTPGAKPERSERGGTRIPCEISATLTIRDAREPFSQQCLIILANLRGCAVRSPAPIPVGTEVWLAGLPAQPEVSAHVVTCISLGQFEHLWLLGLALVEPGNVWGIENVPEDWISDNWENEQFDRQDRKKQA
ncbi:MAG TPA: hypothetical protein VMP68_17050 [Candidatus Eisenbacteria bacterium]|nr:hypothetical protein [Candidatus Eisenbacteria bacterium]